MPSRPLVTGMLAAVVAATALRVVSGPSTPSQTAAAGSYRVSQTHDRPAAKIPDVSWSDLIDKNPETAGERSAKEGLQGALCEVTGRAEEPCLAAAGESTASRPMYTDQDTGEPQVLFAILPDPVHTHLALWFDRSVDALEDAVADTGWEYQKHWIPWALAGGGGGAAKMKDGEQQRLFLGGQEQYPGVILFRPKTSEVGEQKATHPLAVFLIGDSPTGGIDQAQFEQAVRQFHAIAPGQKQLKIVGPNFTGSGPSLHALLSDLKKSDGALAKVGVELASGSISDWRCQDLLPHGVEDPVHGRCSDAASVGVGDSFVSFDTDFRWEVQQTEIYLHEKGHLQYSEMAQLSEDESGFGSLNSVGTQADEILKLTFPRNISHLRSAYQKNNVWGFGSSGEGQNSISLNLDFDESHESDDAVPGFANKQMPVSQEATLGQVTAILEQKHIKAVLLSATDVLDALFVAQILARHSPNLVVVVRGTDVLFLRSGDSGVYHNTYAVGPWPLIPKNYYWSQRAPRLGMRSFPSDHAEGFYAATRYLLTDGAAQLQDYGSPLEATARPPLWFMSIGRGAYWPMALLTKDAKLTRETPKSGLNVLERTSISLPKMAKLSDPEGLHGDDDKPPVTQVLIILGACLLCLMHMGKCLNWKQLAGIAMRYRISEASTRPGKLRVQLGISGLGLLVMCLLCGPAKFPRTMEDWSWIFPLLLGAWALSLALASTAMDLLVGEEKAAENPVGLFWRKVGLSVPVLLATAGAWWMVWDLLPARGTRGEGLTTFFVYRSRYPLSGASPVLPLLLTLAALILYLLNHLDRFTFGDTLRPRLPTCVTGIPNCPDEETMLPLSSLLTYPPKKETVQRKMGILGIITFNVVVVILTIRLAPEMLDGRVLVAVCGLAMLTVLLALLWDLSMAAYLWRQLKGLCLDPLESSSLRMGFNRVSGIAWKDLWLMPRAHQGLSLYRTLSRALEQAGRDVMKEDAWADGAGVGAPLKKLWKLREQVTASVGDHAPRPDEVKLQRETIRMFAEVQSGIEVTAKRVLDELKQQWAGEVGLASAVDEPAEKGGKIEGSGGEGVNVGRLRAAWREDVRSVFPQATFPEGEKEREGPPAKVLQAIREEWIALIYIHYIRMVLIQIRSRLLTSVMLYLLLVLSVTSYPYLNQHVLILALAGVFAILAATAVTTYASVNRDPILSRTTEGKPGELDVDFYIRAASMVGVPLLGLIASQFPEVSSFLFSWIEPGMAAVK